MCECERQPVDTDTHACIIAAKPYEDENAAKPEQTDTICHLGVPDDSHSSNKRLVRSLKISWPWVSVRDKAKGLLLVTVMVTVTRLPR